MTSLNDFYGFQFTPFSRSISTSHLFPAQAPQEIQARLSFATCALRGMHERLPALITGDVGTGKSTALRAFVHALDHNLYPAIYLANPYLKVTALYSQILLALQVEPAYASTPSSPPVNQNAA